MCTELTGFRAPHLAANLGTEDPVGNGNDLSETAHKAGLPDLLGNASVHVTRQKVGNDADSAVVEAAEQTMLKLAASHCQSTSLSSNTGQFSTDRLIRATPTINAIHSHPHRLS